MGSFRNRLQHRLNPLHVYCRLCEFGVSDARAARLMRYYERFIYRLALC